MKKLCVKTLKIDSATFLKGAEYEVSLHPHITGAGGYTYRAAFEELSFADGTPFGVEE